MSRQHRLSPMDQLFLYAETARQPMHVGCLAFYRVAPGHTDDSQVSEVLKELRSCQQVIPPFNYRLVTRYGLPSWQEINDVVLEHHVQHVKLPRPEREALLDLVGNLHARPMDRTKPLWRVWVISGLDDGCYAVYWQMHHALIDGMSGARMIASAHSTDPTERGLKPFWSADRVRGRHTALAEGNSRTVGQISGGRKLLEVPASVARGLLSNWRHERAAPYRGGLFHAPATQINGRITGARRFVTGSMNLTQLRALASQIDGTVNDVLLIVVGRALQRYLDETGNLPEGPLRTLIPVNLRADSSVGGNAFGIVRISIGTDRPSLDELIADVKASVAQQKAVLQKLVSQARQLYTIALLTPMLGHLATGMLGRLRTANTLISNIPGSLSRETLYWNGHEVEAIYPLSIALNECALNITVMSYRDNLEIGLVCCPARVPALRLLIDYMHDSVDELVAWVKPAATGDANPQPSEPDSLTPLFALATAPHPQPSAHIAG